MSKPLPPHVEAQLTMKRRQWLKFSGSTLASALGATSLSGLMLTPSAAQTADYRALVCVFLYGGNDGLNTVTPTDNTRYNEYAGVRAHLALPQSSLVRLTGTDYGLHPSLSALGTAWADGALAPVFNVGPLYQPLTKAEYRAAPNASQLIPDSLFSHSDQQVLWETSSTDAHTRTGWGGRAAAVLGTANPVISVGGNGRFGLSDLQGPLVLPAPGATFGIEGHQNLSWAPIAARKAALDALYADSHQNKLLDAYAKQQRDAFATSDRLGALVKTQPGDANAVAAITQAFAPLIVDGKVTTGIGQQLYQVAKLIHGNATVQGNRQIFFSQLGGFDTHGNQVASNVLQGQHATLLKMLGDAMACFHNAMKAIGMAQQVTLFTQSDFGRTFKPNNSNGTDHAWGNHHLVLGGAVKGRTTYGSYPTLALGGPDDVGVQSWELHGRWIPKVSVDQYAATLLKWFGASDGQLDAVLPHLSNFGSQRVLGFL
jgi:uncharacterized protein (DUF1501 family)